MSDLISRSAFREALKSRTTEVIFTNYQKREEVGYIIDLLDKAPAVDAVPVVHGRWHLLDDCSNEGVYCSVCHKKVYRTDYANQKVKSKFCPNCGADMRERKEK